MSLIDKFLDAIKLNDDFDGEDDYIDDEENEEPAEVRADEPQEEERFSKPRKRKRFFQKFADRKESEAYDEEEDEPEDIPSDSFYDDYDEEEEDPEPVYSRRKTVRGADTYEQSSVRESRSRVRSADTKQVRRETDHAPKKSKVTPIRGRKNPSPAMEVNVIRPSSMEDTWEIADTLLDGCTVVINLEGLDVDVAQRVVDFTCGVCYSLSGNLQKISNYIFILTPEGVDISGDFQDFLNGAFDIPPMRAQY
ncbi:MAG: cell division protein SepF [Eubacteriales bacterium]|jgi:cell division inhibitor SepF